MARAPFLVVKTGSTLRAAGVRGGDFEDWILAGMEVARDDALVVDVREEGATLPEAGHLAGVVITGSASMVSHRLAWSERGATWLRDAVDRGAPVLGICYGHQLLAHALGGVVSKNPRGREVGSITARLRPDAHADPLLGYVAAGRPALAVQATHTESVVTLPEGARLLAESDGDPHQAFVFGEHAWGVQFHPELDASTLRAYIHARTPALREEGLDPLEVLGRTGESADGGRLLRRFAALCLQRVSK